MILRPKAEYAMEAPGLTHSKKLKRVSPAGQLMASIFWDSQDIIKVDYLTINGTYYAEELRQLHQ